MKQQESLWSSCCAWLMLSGSLCARSAGRKGGKVHFYQRLEGNRGLLMICYFGIEPTLCYFMFSSKTVTIFHGDTIYPGHRQTKWWCIFIYKDLFSFFWPIPWSLGSVQPGIAFPATQCLFKYLTLNNSSSNQGGKIMFYSMNEQTLPCHILKFFLQKIVDSADFYISQVKFISGFWACSV